MVILEEAKKMLNFTVGPVMSPDEVLSVAGQDAPYFRTPEFSDVVLRCERAMLDSLHAPDGSRCVFLTASGTGAMEAVVMDVLRPGEHVAVVNGGSFGQRFVDLCSLHGHEVDEVRLDFGKQITREMLESCVGDAVTALLVNMHETSSGLLYDMLLISDFCRSRGITLLVDAVSAFIADELDMGQLSADVVLTGSQKGLACHPGMSIVALSPAAQKRVDSNPETCKYLSLKEALRNAGRGQTPWTPAVSIVLEIDARLRSISETGIDSERREMRSRAFAVREALSSTSLRLVAESPSNAVSAFYCPGHNAKLIVDRAKSHYDMWLCPNGGELADDVFRIGHIGYITEEQNANLVRALKQMSLDGLF